MALKRSYIVISSEHEQENIPPDSAIELSDNDHDRTPSEPVKQPLRARKATVEDCSGEDEPKRASQLSPPRSKKKRRARRVVDSHSEDPTFQSSDAGGKAAFSIAQSGSLENVPKPVFIYPTVVGLPSSNVERLSAPADLFADSEAELSGNEDSDAVLTDDDESESGLSDEEGYESDESSDELRTNSQKSGKSSNSISAAIYTLVATVLWTFISETPAGLKNPIYAMLFFGAAVLAGVMSRYSLCFAPGVLDALQNAKPPTRAFFKSLPTLWNGIWAVYVLVLEKNGCRWMIYIGSGTNADLGVKSRLSHYDDEKFAQLPRFVVQALRKGYRITHKGLLCWTPIPSAGKYFLGRALILALEAWLCFSLWAMHSRTKDYGMPHVCPWSLDELGYDGLCSHSALHEGIPGESAELTLEQVAAKEIAMKKSRRAAKSARTIAWRNTVRERDPEKFAAKRRAYDAPRMPLISARSKKNKANNISTGKYRCKPCDKNFDSPSALTRHEKKQCHKDRVAGLRPKETKNLKHQRYYQRNKKSKRFFCDPCQLATISRKDLDEHKKTARHLKKVAAMQELHAEGSE